MSRLAIAWRWTTHPWRDPALIVALVTAAAAPAMLSASADLWETATIDEVVSTLVEAEEPADLGVAIKADVSLTNEPVPELRHLVGRRLSEIRSLGPVRISTFTYSGSLTDAAGGALGVLPVRLLSGEGAIEAVQPVGVAVPGDAWISTWLSDRTGLGPGDTFRFVADADPNTPGADIVGGLGSSAEFTIAGAYEPLWNEDGSLPGGYWTGLPAGLLPRFVGPFGEPGFELIIVQDEALLSSSLPGAVEWQARLEGSPGTVDAAEALRSEYRTLETDLVRGPLAEAFAAAAPGGSSRLEFRSELPGAVADARSATGFLVQPLGASRQAGLALGVLVMASAGALVVHRRRTEFRLLAGEGERWVKLAGRTAGQLVGPVVVGSALGVALAAITVSQIGPAVNPTTRGVQLDRLAVVSLAGLTAASVVAGFAGQATLGLQRRRPPGLAAVVAGSTIASLFLWVQLERTEAGSTVDLALVTLPIVGLLAASSAALMLLRSLQRRNGRMSRNMPTVVALSLRRLASPDRSSVVLVTALAVGVGLAILSSHLVLTLGRAVDIKLATELGGETNLDVFGPDPGASLPDTLSTIIRTQDTRISPGQLPVRVVAIDPDTVSTSIIWPEDFGMPLSEVLELLQGGDDRSAVAIAVAGRDVPGEGAFGTSQPIPYRVVATVASVPLASSVSPTLLVSGPQVDEVELNRVILAVGAEEASSVYRRPTDRFRRHLVTPLPPSSLEDALRAADLEVREETTRAGRMVEPDILVPRVAFSFLQVLGWVAAASAGAGLLLYLSARRRALALERLILTRMGLGLRRAGLVTALEVGLQLLVAATSAIGVVLVVSAGLLRRFEPAPLLPPTIQPRALSGSSWAWTAAATALTIALVWVGEQRSSRRPANRGVTDA